MDPATTAMAAGAFMGGLGSLAGGLGFGSDSPKVDYKGAKRGIRWRVRDARKAGIHPLYAMGAPGVGSGVLTPSSGGKDYAQMGAGLEQMGQGVGRYFGKPTRQEVERQKAYDRWMQTQAAQQQGIQTEMMHTELAMLNSQFRRDMQSAGYQEQIPSLFVPYYDNQTGETTYLVNPQAGMEPMEMIGTGYWGRARGLTPENYRSNPYTK